MPFYPDKDGYRAAANAIREAYTLTEATQALLTLIEREVRKELDSLGKELATYADSAPAYHNQERYVLISTILKHRAKLQEEQDE